MPGLVALPFMTYNLRVKRKRVCCSMLVTTSPDVQQVSFVNAVTNLATKDEDQSG
jgi:hypothetical protein